MNEVRVHPPSLLTFALVALFDQAPDEPITVRTEGRTVKGVHCEVMRFATHGLLSFLYLIEIKSNQNQL